MSLPNFTTPIARDAEKTLHSVLSQLTQTYTPPAPGVILSVLSTNAPDRYNLVSSKLSKSPPLTSNEVLDKYLGLDASFLYKDLLYGVDIGTGKASTLVNKQRKMHELWPVYEILGYHAVFVLRSKQLLTPELMQNVLSTLPPGISDIRI